MKSDIELQRDVLHELAWEPSVDAAHIGVSVKDGVVTLTGHVPSYAEKYAAERAAKRPCAAGCARGWKRRRPAGRPGRHRVSPRWITRSSWRPEPVPVGPDFPAHGGRPLPGMWANSHYGGVGCTDPSASSSPTIM